MPHAADGQISSWLRIALTHERATFFALQALVEDRERERESREYVLHLADIGRIEFDLLHSRLQRGPAPFMHTWKRMTVA